MAKIGNGSNGRTASYSEFSIMNGNRHIAFSISGHPDGTPTVVFYPLGANRRMLWDQMQHASAIESGICLICVNRPGMAGTCSAGYDAKDHLDTACEDVVAVLDQVGLRRVSVLFMCAGTPFGLAFAIKYPDRITGLLLGVAAMTSPAHDPNAKGIFRVGAQLPISMICYVTGNFGAGLGSINSNYSNSNHSNSNYSNSNSARSENSGSAQKQEAKGDALERDTEERTKLVDEFTRCLSGFEAATFRAAFPDAITFTYGPEGHPETGGVAEDINVLFSRYEVIGINLSMVPGNVVLVHGESDQTVPFPCAEWLKAQLPQANIKCLPHATHKGTIMQFNPQLCKALVHLRCPEARMRKLANIRAVIPQTNAIPNDDIKHRMLQYQSRRAELDSRNWG